MPRNILDPTPGDRDRLYSVSELAAEFGITVRAVRFYEGKKLLAPGRAGANRVYTYRDRARLVLILRGKRIGLSLGEIKVFLGLYHADPSGKVQLHSLLSMIKEHIESLEHQRDVLETTLADLCRMARTVQEDLSSGLDSYRERHAPGASGSGSAPVASPAAGKPAADEAAPTERATERRRPSLADRPEASGAAAHTKPPARTGQVLSKMARAR